MPAPFREPDAGPGGEGPVGADGDETEGADMEEGEHGASQTNTPSRHSSQASYGRWTPEEWRAWNEAYSTHHYPAEEGRASNDAGISGNGVSASTSGNSFQPRLSQQDTWLNSDPWSRPLYESSRGGGGGGQDKIQVPEYNGEEDRDGLKARGYLRKVDAWRRVTRLTTSKQALMLYNSLSGRAWRDAEELDLSTLDAENGVEVFCDWIRARYLDKEVTRVGRCMSEFFKQLKKGQTSDIREFNQEFDRQLARLREVGCVLPDVCAAWWYLDKLRLDNPTELNLLASVGNAYSLTKLQDAAVIQDRMNRRLWEKRGQGHEHDAKKKSHQAYVASGPGGDDGSGDDTDGASLDEADGFDSEDAEAHEAYVAFQNAKSKYQAAIKDRGFKMSKEERLRLAKQRSYCSVCHKKGHWHKDSECPANKGKASSSEPHTTHVVYYTDGNKDANEGFMGITDCACSRTLAGKPWLVKFIKALKKRQIPHILMEQNEVFKFGGEKLYPSKIAVVTWVNIEGKWFLLKISMVSAEVPLLLSRPVLARLGMKYDLANNRAAFRTLDVEEVQLSSTQSGHPQVEILGRAGNCPEWPDRVDWSVTEIFVDQPQVVYMSEFAEGDGGAVQTLFFGKKVGKSVEQLLTRDPFSSESFMHWWREKDYLRDFWIETPDFLYRVHVTPRSTMFSPLHWKTGNHELKKQLLAVLDDERETVMIPCTMSGKQSTLRHCWRDESDHGRTRFLWVGRSRFRRRSKPVCPVSDKATIGSLHFDADAMEDESCRASGCPGRGRDSHEVGLDSAGTTFLARGASSRTRAEESEVNRLHLQDPRRADESVPGAANPSSPEAYSRISDEDASRTSSGGRQRGGQLREVQGLHATGASHELPEVGDRGGGEGAGSFSGSDESGQLGQGGSREASWGWPWNFFSNDKSHQGSRDDGIKESTSDGTSSKDSSKSEGEGEDHESSPELGCDGHRRGPGHRLLPGECGGDQRQGEGALEEDQGFGGTADSAQISNKRRKARRYWEQRDQAIRLKRRKGEGQDLEECYNLDYDQVINYDMVDEPDHENVEEVYKTELLPKVTLKYPDDYEAVRRLPSHKMKRTSRKRVRGWAARTLAAMITTVTAFSAMTATAIGDATAAAVAPLRRFVPGLPVDGAEDRVALLELFCGSANLTMAFARAGFSVLEPRDIQIGHDLFTQEEQERVLSDIEEFRPELVWIALPCTVWGPWTRINYADNPQALRRLRKKQRKLVRFCRRVADKVKKCGGEVVFEHPAQSDLWEGPAMKEIVCDIELYPALLDMCQYGLEAKTNGMPLKKPTQLLCSNEIYCQRLEKMCPGDHEHTPTAGANTKPSGTYCREFCKAVVRAYRAVNRARWVSFPAEVKEERQLDGVAEDLTVEKVEKSVGASGIRFPVQVPNHVASALRRIHQNMGHPSNKDLARHLKLAGAGEAAVNGALKLSCETCNRKASEKSRRPAHLYKPLDFNEEVAIDTMHLFNNAQEKFTVLSMVDLASGYHLVKKLTGRTAEELANTFLEAWVSWAGSPMSVLVDQERGMLKSFPDQMEKHGIKIRYTAGQAHWQNGHVERQNQWFRAIFEKVLEHDVTTDDEVEWALAEVCQAKNHLRRRHGYSPPQWVFGVNPRLGDGLLEEEDNTLERQQLISPGDDWKKKQGIRIAAREAFLKTQAVESLARANLGRPRVHQGDFTQGQYVYIYRKCKVTGGTARRRPDVGEWIGPGVIVGKEGDNYWVSRGGRCLLCAREHLRLAESEELGASFQARAVKDDLAQLIENMDLEDDEVFADARGQGRLELEDLEESHGEKRKVDGVCAS